MVLEMCVLLLRDAEKEGVDRSVQDSHDHPWEKHLKGIAGARSVLPPIIKNFCGFQKYSSLIRTVLDFGLDGGKRDEARCHFYFLGNLKPHHSFFSKHHWTKTSLLHLSICSVVVESACLGSQEPVGMSLSLSIQGGQAGSSPSATVGIFMEIVDATNCALPSQQHTCSHPPPRTSLVHTFSYSFKSNPIRAPACYAWEHRDHLFHLSIETFAIYCGWRFFGVNFTVPPCNLEWYLRGL